MIKPTSNSPTNGSPSKVTPSTDAQIALQVDSVSKRFPGVIALDNVSLNLHAGEVLSVIGENGAGKSTLMKILAGIQPPDEGRVLVEGVEKKIDSVVVAQENGISLIHQELNLCENLGVGANIFLGREPKRLGFVNREKIRREAATFLKQVGLDVSPDTLVGELTIGQQQMVEIAKAVSTNAKIVIMDEPTSSLSQRETENLFEIIRTLNSRGVSIVYISHRLSEVQTLSDRVVVLRDGKNAGELAKHEISHQAMVEKMVGRELNNYYARNSKPRENKVLEVNKVATFAYPHCKVSFEMRAGEVVGIAGLVGAGRTELLTTLFGITPARSGEIRLDGKLVNIADSQTAMQNGIGLVPEDRKAQGVVLPMSVRENTSLATMERMTRFGFIDDAAENHLAEDMRQRLGTKTPNVEQPVKFLSGGNQQKVVIAKWLALEPKLLLLDEPTRGVDVGAKQEIYKLMDELAQTGVAILFVSSDMEEVLGMADRIIVMHEGRVSGGLQKADFSEQAVMRLMTGTDSFVESVSTSGNTGASQ